MTYRDLDELVAPNNVVFVIGGRRVWNRLHVLKECGLGFAEESSHIDKDAIVDEDGSR
jgi:hypothetical protein